MKKILSLALGMVLIAGAANAQTDEGGKKHHKGNHDMMKTLNLTDEQKAKLKSIREDERKEMKSLKATSVEKDDLKAKRMELHKKYADQFQSVLTPAQKEQMQKARTEGRKNGKGMKEGRGKDFKKGEGFKNLGLSDAQKSKMESLRKENRSQFESIKNDRSLSDDAKKDKMKELRKQQQEQMKSILTPEQLEKIKSARKPGFEKNKK